MLPEGFTQLLRKHPGSRHFPSPHPPMPESHNLCPITRGSGPSTLHCVRGIRDQTHELFWVLPRPGQMLQSPLRFYSGRPAHMPFSRNASALPSQGAERGHAQGTSVPSVASPGPHSPPAGAGGRVGCARAAEGLATRERQGNKEVGVQGSGGCSPGPRPHPRPLLRQGPQASAGESHHRAPRCTSYAVGTGPALPCRLTRSDPGS